ncbi:NAD(P)H-hydrate epimerase [Paracoccus sp. YIM 132242]|uniref:Bifunctional NAD(P)H-hydrate repair enzyme n=1 Tax=Paracoccus lichenicola TaxID=2665644 RepID=A0A6L6HIG6_9RHOB|nr:NAD(P)H-hydrate epimerase [Paracoccus lichenicola]MTD98946.1 NAD(P)H-hydrate epimerase [Paracoccus lichenicola]
MLEGTEVLTTAQMRAIESAAMASGQVTGLELMERAGRAVAGQIRLRWPKAGRATVLCGPGNNGGDGYVVARLLHRAEWRVRVLGMDNTPGPDAGEMRRRWREIGGIAPLTEQELQSGTESDVYVDAIFGTGLTRPPEGEIANILARVFGRGGDGAYYCRRLVAVDCPSGFCMDSGKAPALPPGRGTFDSPARLTVAFDSPKPGHLIGLGPALCGELVVADIGLRQWRERHPGGLGQRPARLEAIWPRFDIRDGRRIGVPLSDRLGKHSSASPHKYGHGHALILAGGPAKGGAARLSARTALRIGAGLATIAPPQDALPEHAGQPDALMRRAIDGGGDLREALADSRINALCFGPGCGIDRSADLLAAALPARRATVLDADALTALSHDPALMAALHRDCVLTPHMGEFARLFPDLARQMEGPKPPARLRHVDAGDPGRLAQFSADMARYNCEMIEWTQGPAYSKLDAAREAAARCGAVVLLKGPDTVIAAPDGSARLHSAFDVPWLATAGAGDVLAGMIAGLLARGFQPLDAASLGTLIHAQTARGFGPGLIADDLPDLIPAVLRGLQKSQSSSSVATALPMT